MCLRLQPVHDSQEWQQSSLSIRSSQSGIQKLCSTVRRQASVGDFAFS